MTKQRDPETGQQSLLFQVRGLLLCQEFLSSELRHYWSFINPLQGNSSHLTWIRHSRCKSSTTHSCQSVQRLHVQIMAWLPVFGIFNMCTGFGACAATQGLSRHCKRVHWRLRLGALKVMSRYTESYIWERTALPHQGIEPMSVRDTQPTELSHPQNHYQI